MCLVYITEAVQENTHIKHWLLSKHVMSCGTGRQQLPIKGLYNPKWCQPCSCMLRQPPAGVHSEVSHEARHIWPQRQWGSKVLLAQSVRCRSVQLNANTTVHSHLPSEHVPESSTTSNDKSEISGGLTSEDGEEKKKVGELQNFFFFFEGRTFTGNLLHSILYALFLKSNVQNMLYTTTHELLSKERFNSWK